MLRTDKERIVSELAAELESAETLIVADYRGLTNKQLEALRDELLKHGARFRIVKNTLTRRAAEQAGAEALFVMLEGPTAIAFVESAGDPAAALAVARRAAAVANVPSVAYIARLLAGRALEALDRPVEAAEQYRGSLELVPGAESATIALASLQFVHEDREHALEATARTFATANPPIDPGRLIGYGSFMHWPRLRADVRAALRP